MQKNFDKDTGKLHLDFTAKDVKKLKIGAGIAGGVFIIALCTAIYSAYSMTSLRAENALYQNQLKMADEKLQTLDTKTKSVEKLSSQLQQLIQANNTGAASSLSGDASQDGSSGGQGGGSTVPDKANTETPKSEEEASSSTPGELLKHMRKLDNELNSQIRLVVNLRQTYLSQTTGQTTGLPVQVVKGSGVSEVTPDIWPIHGTISSYFGFRSSPGGIGSTYHEGLDIAADYGEPVLATADGSVTQAGWVSGYGNLVEIRHADGIVTRYGHNSALLVSVGQEVHQGDVISLVGSTGNSTGPHCHYEVRVNGNAVDPLYFLPGGN